VRLIKSTSPKIKTKRLRTIALLCLELQVEENRKATFHAFDRDAEIACSERNLPHWFQVDAAMFITFRTADSLPREVVIRMQRELEDWLSHKKLPIELAVSTVGVKLPNHEQLLNTLSVTERKQFRKLADRLFHHALDECHGKCVLKRHELASIVANSILHRDDDAYDLDCFVVMPNHIHAIVQFRDDSGKAIVGQSWMRYTARLINPKIGESGAFWQAEPFDHIIRSAEQFAYLQNYVASNPAKANLHSGEYLFWQREE
jgi:putative transposase